MHVFVLSLHSRPLDARQHQSPGTRLQFLFLFLLPPPPSSLTAAFLPVLISYVFSIVSFFSSDRIDLCVSPSSSGRESFTSNSLFSTPSRRRGEGGNIPVSPSDGKRWGSGRHSHFSPSIHLPSSSSSPTQTAFDLKKESLPPLLPFHRHRSRAGEESIL